MLFFREHFDMTLNCPKKVLRRRERKEERWKEARKKEEEGQVDRRLYGRICTPPTHTKLTQKCRCAATLPLMPPHLLDVVLFPPPMGECGLRGQW